MSRLNERLEKEASKLVTEKFGYINNNKQTPVLTAVVLTFSEEYCEDKEYKFTIDAIRKSPVNGGNGYIEEPFHANGIAIVKNAKVEDVEL